MSGSLISCPPLAVSRRQNAGGTVRRDDHPAPRLVLYFTGNPGAGYANVFQLSTAVEARGWRVVDVRSDVGDDEMAWLRKGLLSAITIVCHGRADGIAMFESVYESLTTDDQNWLSQRIRHFGGYLHVVSDEA